VTGDSRACEPVQLDATGLRCPLPVIRLALLVRDLPDGTLVRVLSTDPAAGPDLAAWCRMRDHRLLDQQPDPPDRLVSLIRLGPSGHAGPAGQAARTQAAEQ
jgi:tRNA 2-thiouridine synthesizing protein A